MQYPHHVSDAYDQEMCDMVDADANAIETLAEQLLSDRMITYYDKKHERHTVYLDKIIDDYAVEIREGEDMKEIIEYVLNEIVESIRG